MPRCCPGPAEGCCDAECGGCQRREKSGSATLIRQRAAGQCDGKSLVHLSMRPEGRQPVQIGSRIKISQGQVQGTHRGPRASGWRFGQ